MIPVLVDDAEMPEEAELPEALWPLRRRQALRLSHASFNSDVGEAGRRADRASRSASGRPGRASPAQPAPAADDAVPRSRLLPGHRRRVTGEWTQAVELFTAVQQRFPTDERVTARCEARRGRKQLETRREAEARGAWRAAVASLEELAADRPGDQTLRTGWRMRGERSRSRICSASCARCPWRRSGRGRGVERRIAQLDPERADPDGLAAIGADQVWPSGTSENRYAVGLAALNAANDRRGRRGVRGHPAAAAGLPRGRRPGQHDSASGWRTLRWATGPAPSPPPATVCRGDDAGGPAAGSRRPRRPRPTRPLADTGRIWLVIGAMALLVMMAQSLDRRPGHRLPHDRHGRAARHADAPGQRATRTTGRRPAADLVGRRRADRPGAGGPLQRQRDPVRSLPVRVQVRGERRVRLLAGPPGHPAGPGGRSACSGSRCCAASSAGRRSGRP